MTALNRRFCPMSDNLRPLSFEKLMGLLIEEHNAFGTIFGARIGSLILALALSLFALTTILSWSLYGSRCCEYILGAKSVPVYQILFVAVIVIGASLKLDLVWNIADTLNGFMAVPNLIAILGLSGVVIKLTKEHFSK